MIEYWLCFYISCRQEIVRTGKADPSGQCRWRKTCRRQPARSFALRPCNRARTVLQESRIANLRIQSVTRDDRDDCLRSERLTDELVILALAAGPCPAMEKHHDWAGVERHFGVRRRVWLVHVQLCARLRPVCKVRSRRVRSRRHQPVDDIQGRARAQHRAEQDQCGNDLGNCQAGLLSSDWRFLFAVIAARMAAALLKESGQLYLSAPHQACRVRL